MLKPEDTEITQLAVIVDDIDKALAPWATTWHLRVSREFSVRTENSAGCVR